MNEASHVHNDVSGAGGYLADVQEERGLPGESEALACRLTALHRVTRAVNRSLDLADTLQAALDVTLEVTGVEAGAVLLWDRESNRLVAAVARGLPEVFVREATTWQVSQESLLGQTLLTGEPLILEDLSALPGIKRQVRELGFRAVALVPLTARGEVLGLMNLGSCQSRRFPPAEVQLLTDIADVIGMAIENAELYEVSRRSQEQLREYASQLEEANARLDAALANARLAHQQSQRAENLIRALSAAATAVSAALEPQAILEILSRELKRLGLESVLLLVEEDKEGGEWLAVRHASLSPGQAERVRRIVGLQQRHLRLPVKGVPFFEELFAQQETRFTDDVATLIAEVRWPVPQAVIRKTVRALKLERLVIAPLVTREGVQGILAVWGPDLRAEDTPAMAVFAHQVAVALENARLHEQVKRERVEERDFSRTVLQIAESLIVILDAEGRIVLFNRKAQELTGYTEEEVLGRAFWDFLVPEGCVELHRQLFAHFKADWQGRDRCFEKPWLTKDGRERLISWCNAVVEDAQGNPRYIVLSGIDVTEERRAQEAERRQLAELEARQRLTRAILRTLDLDERLSIALSETMELLGAEMGGIYLAEGERLVLRAHRGLPDDFMAQWRDLALAQTPWASELTVRRERLSERTGAVGEVCKQAGIQAWANMPLKVEGRLVGTIILASHRYEAFSESQVAILSDMGDLVAVAIQHSRLYEDARQRLARLTTLREIDRAIAAQLSLEDILSIVLERVHPHILVDAVGLSLIDWEKKRTLLAHLYLPDGLEVEGEAFRLSEALLDTLVVQRRPVFIYDLLADPRVQNHRHLIRQHNLRSYLGVPLVVQDEVIGVLHVLTTRPHRFSDEEVDFFATLAGQAAIAIQNARLYQAALQRAEHMGLLAETSLSIARAGHGAEVALVVLGAACQVIGAKQAGYLACDPTGQTLSLEAAVGFSPETLALAQERLRGLRLSEPLAPALAGLERRSIYLPDARRTAQRMGFDPNLRSAYFVPLAYGDQLFGVMAFMAAEEDAFTPEQRAMADTFAAYAAAAQENARLYRQAQERLERITALHEIDLAITSTLDITQTLEVLLSHVTERLGVDAAAIYLTDPASGELQIAARRSLPRTEDTPPAYVGQGILGRVAQTGQPIAIADLGKELRFMRQALVEAGFISYLGVPLRSKGKTLGVLELFGRQRREFTPEEVDFFVTLAGQAAIAIDNARLYDETRRWAETLEAQVAERTAEIRRQKEQTEAILHSMAEGVVVLDSSGHPILSNPIAEHWLKETLPVEDARQLMQTMADLAGHADERPEAIIELTGLDIQLRVAPILEGGEWLGTVVVMHDVTQLKEVDRLKSKFVSNVSHELRTPITNIKLYLHLLEQGREERRAHYMETLKREADRQAKLVEDLLTLSRMDAGRLQPDLRPTSAASLVQFCLANYQARAKAAGLTLESELTLDLPPVLADASQITQVLTNLVVNSIHYTPAGGRIIIRTGVAERDDQPYVTLSVADTGMGISPEELPHLFERFFRGEAARRTAAPGTGLGLPIVKEIVDMHGGWIEVQSEVGEGTTFTIGLPVARPASALA